MYSLWKHGVNMSSLLSNFTKLKWNKDKSKIWSGETASNELDSSCTRSESVWCGAKCRQEILKENWEQEGLKL